MIDSRRLTPAASPEAAGPAAAAGLGWPRAGPCAPASPRPPAQLRRGLRGRLRGVDLQPRRTDSAEITSTGKRTPQAQPGRGLKGERRGGEGGGGRGAGEPPLPARAGLREEAAAAVRAFCPHFGGERSSLECGGTPHSLPPGPRPAPPPLGPRVFSTPRGQARERSSPTARGRHIRSFGRDFIERRGRGGSKRDSEIRKRSL